MGRWANIWKLADAPLRESIEKALNDKSITVADLFDRRGSLTCWAFKQPGETREDGEAVTAHSRRDWDEVTVRNLIKIFMLMKKQLLLNAKTKKRQGVSDDHVTMLVRKGPTTSAPWVVVAESVTRGAGGRSSGAARNLRSLFLTHAHTPSATAGGAGR
jgi:hypothetical protein